MLEVQINICPSSFVDKCSTTINSNLSSTDCEGGNMETNQTNPRDDFKDPCVDFDDEIEPTSEVKAYTNEYEEEEGLLETELLSIEDIISGLINESEQCKVARTGGKLAFSRTFLHEDTLHQYLLNTQAASSALFGLQPSLCHSGSTMENLSNRFPHLSERIFTHLDDQSIVKIQNSSKKLYHFTQSNRLYFLRIIHKYNESLNKQSWTKVVTQTSTRIVKKLALALVEFIKSPSCICCCERPTDYMRSGDFKEPTVHDWHPHHIAAEFGHSELYEYIATKTEDFNPATSFGVSSLHVAADEGHIEICKFIIKNAEDRNLEDENGWTPLHFAAENGCIEVYKLILDNTAFKNPKNIYGSTPLHSAARGGHFELFKFIVEESENKNPIDDKGFTTFHHAAFSGNLELCKYLMNLNDTQNTINYDGETPLHLAAENGLLEVCKLLMNDMMDKNPKDNFEDTPLHLASKNGHLEVCKLLMKNLNNKNPKGYRGDTPLHHAADFGDLRLFKFMMEHATDQNPKNDHGNTPLHFTASTKKLKICRFIIENVDDIDTANVEGKTPLDYALEHKCHDIVELLKQKRKKINIHMTSTQKM